jgi:2-polyprenyl-6-methoxyphenol hydroxylase-like FAD-dependent oxidoreductase
MLGEAHNLDAAGEPGCDRVVIVGGGMAGSLLALVLGRAGHAVSLVDLRRDPPSDFRNEKLGIDQIEHLAALGVLSCFEEACWGDGATPAVEADGRRPPLKDCGARYDRWITRIRAALPPQVSFVEGKVDQIETSDDRQTVVLTSGETITGRLAVLATGRGERLRAGLGISRRVFSERHSLCLGFSVAPQAGDPWDVVANIWHGRFGDRIAYMTIFPMLDEIRVNVFCYREPDDPWVRRMRDDPVGVLAQTVPGAGAVLAGLQVVRPLEVRSTDLYAVRGHVRPGVVLLGDAFHAPCPSSGTGMTRILNDVDRLARVHVPAWMRTPGMSQSKIAAFYADPVKRRVDRASVQRSLGARGAATSLSPYWRARRSLGVLKRNLLPDFAKAARGLRPRAAAYPRAFNGATPSA